MEQHQTGNETPIPFVYTRPIFWGDTDTAQIAYTGRFVDFMMEAAESWMRVYLGADWFVQATEMKRGGPIAHLEMDFMSPLTPKDLLEVEVRIPRAGETSITYECTGYGNDRRLSFRGRFTSVGFEYASGTKKPLPQEWRDSIAEYQQRCVGVDGD